MPSAARLCAGARVISVPASAIRPAVIRVRPMIVFSTVDLPEPLAPSTARISPGANRSDSPSSTVIGAIAGADIGELEESRPAHAG